MDSTYEQLLDRAFAQLPSLAAEKSDFKVPEVDSIIQGSKTIIRNFSQIADAARREEGDISKYLSKELAAPVSLGEQKLTISTKVQNAVLNDKVKKYFDAYVICKECHKPDTHIEGSERGYETLVCEACGARYTVKRS
ncbi:MAG: translation initiation factor IF-2 subunit beta [Candidatus Micrarchaeota archaeon]|nr:translation initiation factor IF-2 subunit beta [Candidatus Micrarchaeota archaeon]